MTDQPGFLSLLPPLLAIVLAIATREVMLSLLAGLVLGYTILADWNVLAGIANSIEGIVNVFADAGDTRVLLFSLLVGSLILLMRRGGGVTGFVHFIEQRGWVRSPRGAQMLAWVLGVVIFIESNVTILISGTLARPLFDRYRVSREKLAYLIDSTSAPVCVLIPLNAWGAFILALLAGLGLQDPLGTFIAAIPLNFYAWLAVLIAGLSAFFSLDIFGMKNAQPVAPGSEDAEEAQVSATQLPYARNMIVPVLVMILVMPLGMYITGDGDLREGSGSTSVLWSILAAVFVACVLLLSQRRYSIHQLMKINLQGAGQLLPIAAILLFALALSDLSKALHTGEYVAGLLSTELSPALLLPASFVLTSFMAFSIGSSWGTFGIMIPIVIPAAIALNLPVAPFLATVLAGGIFGDHVSPISDTTVISSLASGSDHIAHVRTQIPYALIASALAIVGFTFTGLSI